MKSKTGKWELLDPQHGNSQQMIKVILDYLNLDLYRRSNFDKYGQHWSEYKIKERKDD